jgi:hypothetical protein
MTSAKDGSGIEQTFINIVRDWTRTADKSAHEQAQRERAQSKIGKKDLMAPRETKKGCCGS